MLPLLAQIHNAESIKQNMMLKCLYFYFFFSHSSHACKVFFPEAGLSVRFLMHTCHSELLCGLCRCGFIPNPLVSPPMWRSHCVCFVPSNDLICCLRFLKTLLHDQHIEGTGWRAFLWVFLCLLWDIDLAPSYILVCFVVFGFFSSAIHNGQFRFELQACCTRLPAVLGSE